VSIYTHNHDVRAEVTGFSAIMKTFLDRLGFVFHRPRFHGKAFTGIVVQGIYGGAKIEKYLASAGGGLGFNVSELAAKESDK
jgi:multimeric flavodoxin WrbA